jgi:hypothetical protein
MESLSRSTIKRPALGRAQAGGRSQARGHARAGGGQPDRHSNISQKGTRLGNWLTREKARELLAVPDRSTLKGKRDYVILALLGSPQNTDIKARLGVCASIRSMTYSRALRSMEVQRARHNKLFICSKRCCLPYSMIPYSEATPFWTCKQVPD